MSEITIDNKLSVGMGSSVEEIADAVAKVVPAATTIATEVAAALPAPATPSDIAAAVAASMPASATPAQVASAVVSALPHTPTAAEIAAAVTSSMPTPATVLAGQVVEFAAGQVPAGYAQVSGPEAVSAGAWEYAWPSYGHGKGPGTSRIYSAGGKLVQMYGDTTPSLQVLNDDYTPNGAAITLPSAYYYYVHRLTPLANGKLLRIGSFTNSSGGSSTVVQTFDPVTRSVASLQSKPTAIAAGFIAVEAGNGDVFVFNGTQVDRFSGNVWTENVAAMPAAVLNAEKLPSGKLLVICANAQYVFNPATPTQFTAVASPVSVSSYVVAGATSGGVRVIDPGATVAGLTMTLVAYDYNESTGQYTTLKGYARTPGAVGNVNFANFTTKLKDGGIMLCGSASTGVDALVHHLAYTPAGTVKAVKL